MIWGHVPPRQDLHPLVQSTRTQVCVVGAGVSGLTTAYLLGRAGHSVVLLDTVDVGAGDSHHTTAHLSAALDDGLANVEDWHGRSLARALVHGHRGAIDLIESLARSSGKDCGFERVPGYLAARPGTPADLEKEAHAARRLGLEANIVTKSPLGWGPALRFDDQAQIQPVAYLDALRELCRQEGVRIHPGTRVVGVAEKSDHVTVHVAAGHRVHADRAVIATNAPIAGTPTVHTKMAPHRTYALAARLDGEMPPALLWDREDPYHYVRTYGPGARDLVIAGGADHRTGRGSALAHQKLLTAWAREHLPGLVSIEAQWSGQIMETPDGAGFIGGSGRIHLITGDSGHGYTNGTLGAALVAAWIAGDARTVRAQEAVPDDPTDLWAAVGVERFPKAFGALLRFNLNVAGQAARRALPGVEDKVPHRGQGRVLERGWGKVACYRGEDGRFYQMDAHCTHKGCIVGWNDAERTWDCPCHGSRYSPRGEVLQGPATRGLDKVQAPRAPSMAERELQEQQEQQEQQEPGQEPVPGEERHDEAERAGLRRPPE